MSGRRGRPVERVLLLVNTLVDGGGVGEVNRQALRALTAGSGLPQVEVLALHGEAASPRGARVLTARGSRARLGAHVVAAAARSCRTTLVLAMHVNLAPVALPLTLRGAELAVFLYGIDAWARLPWHRRRALERADLLLSISQYTAARFREAQAPASWPRLEVCHLGAPDLPAAPRRLATRPTALVVGRLSSTERYKGHDELLDVWPEVKRALPGARLIVAGDGDDRPRLEARRRAPGIDDDVLFLGRVDDDELRALYAQAHAFAMPSRGEGFGLVYVEAMRAGVPCVGAPGAAEEVIVHEETGLIVEPTDRGALRQALVRLLGDTATSTAMGLAGRARFDDRFTEVHFHRRLRAALGLPAGTPDALS